MKTTILWLLLICSFCISLTAQNIQQKRWVLDNQRIDFTTNPPQLVAGGLPQYPISATPRSGALNSIHDADKNLLFYIDKENQVRNKNGNPIGNSGLGGIIVGGSEISVIPVPGSACKYYLVYLDQKISPFGGCPTGQNSTTYSMVDLSLNNNQGDLVNLNTPLESCKHDLRGVLAVSPLVNNGTTRYLYKVGFSSTGTFQVLRYVVTAAGISAPTTIYSSFGGLGNIRSAEADLSPDGTKLAFANETFFNPSSGNDVFVIHLNPITGGLNTAAGTNGISSFNIPGTEFTGVEFSPNSNNLFVGQVGVGIHKIDMVGTAPISKITGTDAYGNSQLELGYDPFGNYKIYATNGTGLRSINDPNTNFPTFSSISLLTGITPFLGTNSQVFQLPDQLDGFNYDEPFSNVEPTCCAALTSFTVANHTATTNATWTVASNPFNAGTVKIQNELLIPSGKNVTIRGMRFEFGPGAKIIVQKGARLTIDNSTLTSISCQDLWEGIEVAGINGSSQYSILSATGLREQGHLIITNNSLIENAHEAIRLVLGNNLATTGGIVWANNSTFRNNWRSAEFLKYQNKTLQGAPTNNISFFKDCIFETTINQLIDGRIPYYFVTMWMVDGVGLQGNTFKNISSQTDVLKRGSGIKSIDAKYKVLGYCTVATQYGVPCSSNNLRPNKFENLAYGIDASSSNVMNTVTISNNKFDNNWRGILLRGMDFAVVTENIFDIGASYTGVLPTYPDSYGLYTEQCSGYKIESNNFFTTHGGIFGTYTWNSGTAPNRIYRNTFSGVQIGSAASETNGLGIANGPGLEYRCNNYNCLFADIAVMSGTIAQHQGYCHTGGSDPAGNIFTQNNAFNLYKFPHDPLTSFVYFFHSSAGIREPRTAAMSPFIAKTASLCNPFNPLNDCKSTIYPDPGYIKGSKQQLMAILQQEKSLIDGGNTTNLIASLTNLSIGQAKNLIMSVSPYASDAALLAYLATNPPLGHLQQVISANAPVTTTVWNQLEQMNLPNGIETQLTALQTGTSARAELEGRIAYYEKEIWLMTDELIRYYLNDTIVTDPMDSVIVLLKEQNRQTMKCQQFAAEIKAGKLTDADATAAAIATAQGGQITDNYCKLLNILLELEKASLSCLNLSNTDENTVRDIAADDTHRGCAQAKALLNIAFNESFPETIEQIQLSNLSLRENDPNNLTDLQADRNSVEQENNTETVLSTKPLDQSYRLETYPNPFDKILTVNTSIPNDIKNAKFIIFDVLGKELKNIRVPNGASTIEINGEELQEGILYYVLILDDKIVENGKIVYMKNN